MTYEIWDTPSGNLIAHFDRYGQALDFMRDQVDRLGSPSVDGVVLFEVQGDGHSRAIVAEDRALLPLLRVPARTTG